MAQVRPHLPVIGDVVRCAHEGAPSAREDVPELLLVPFGLAAATDGDEAIEESPPEA